MLLDLQIMFSKLKKHRKKHFGPKQEHVAPITMNEVVMAFCGVTSIMDSDTLPVFGICTPPMVIAKPGMKGLD
jgi:hypothetical protein